MADQLDFVHALWIEWRQQWVQTNALLAFAGAQEKIEPDPHKVFDEMFSPTPPAPARRPRTPQEIADRRAVIARLAGG